MHESIETELPTFKRKMRLDCGKVCARGNGRVNMLHARAREPRRVFNRETPWGNHDAVGVGVHGLR